MNDEVEIIRAYHNVKFRYIVMPKLKLDSWYNELLMNPKLI